jgi:hypothetical protein
MFASFDREAPMMPRFAQRYGNAWVAGWGSWKAGIVSANAGAAHRSLNSSITTSPRARSKLELCQLGSESTHSSSVAGGSLRGIQRVKCRTARLNMWGVLVLGMTGIIVAGAAALNHTEGG